AVARTPARGGRAGRSAARIRRSQAQPPIPIASVITAPIINDIGTPQADAIAPINSPPAGTDAAKIVVSKLITRPRRWSGAASWIVVLAVTAIPIPPAPASAIATSESPNEVEAASA